ncbi:MAG: LacI family DNA-binding transcriptional regulator [Planctomycetes bacterium]|nr:LacI family DNA-binding transcriptional regulator [Planctomycetota bacterium]
MTTIRDIARAAGVSETTVSLSFRAGSRISAPTREKIQLIARQIGYVPDLAARTLRLSDSRTIGMLILDIANPFYARMAREVETTARGLGYQVLIGESRWDDARETAQVERMLQAKVRGIIACFCETADEGWRLLAVRNMPCVAVDNVPENYRGPYVRNDLETAGRLAASHLIETGRRRPVLLIPEGSHPRFSTFQALKKGFAEELAQAGVPFDPARQAIASGLTIDDGKTAFERLRAAGLEADGVLCGNDLCALGVMEAADAAGVRPGPDLAVIGIDNLEIGRLARISLTSIRQPDVALAAEATNALIEGIESGGSVQIRSTHQPELIIRASSRR